MNREEVLNIFRECGAILEGHFILTSGLHSPIFLQKARVFMYPEKTEILCKALADKIKTMVGNCAQFVISPAIGGLVPGFETAKHLGIPAMWVEREQGKFALRRFDLPQNSKVIIVEDIVTTGLSIRETVNCMQELGAEVVACACLIDRSAGSADTCVPLIALTDYDVPAYAPNDLPPELEAIQPVEPGSRNIFR